MPPEPFLGTLLFWGLAAWFFAFTWTSLREREKRAFIRAGLLSALMLGTSVLLLLGTPSAVRNAVFTGLLLGFGIFLLAMGLAPKPSTGVTIRDTPGRIDERDVIFARFDLEPGSRRYNEYYRSHPEFEERDARIRRMPDVLSSAHLRKAPLLLRLAEAEFAFLERQLGGVDGPIASQRTSSHPEENTRCLKAVLRYLGADLCGVCALDPAFLYTHAGRGPEPYGRPIRLDHRYAVVFAVEMRFSMIASAPLPPVIVETGKQYVSAARIAIIAAETIRSLGFPARAHMAGSSYAAMLPPLAWKAGLGEVGRIGILLTEKFGPRIRLGLVTTDMPLAEDRPSVFGVQDFCMRCEKCALNCPGNAIPKGDRVLENGVLRWVIDREACYEFWRKTGTDCARCISVCPYSKPNTWVHRSVRWAASRSRAFQRLAVVADDLFYGRRPAAHGPQGLPADFP